MNTPRLTVALVTALVASAAAPASAEPLTLEAAQELARERNETWAIVRARVDQSRALLAGAESALWPTARVDASITRNPEEVLIGDRVIQPLFNWTASGTAGVVLFDGTLYPAIDAARADVAALEADAAWRARLVELEVANAWYALAAAQAQVELVDAFLELRREDVTRAEKLVAADRGVPLDVARAEADLLTTQQRRIEAVAARDDAADALAVLVAEPADGTLRAADAPAALAAPAQLADPGDLAAREDLAAAERAIASARLAEEAQAWAWWPTLGLSANALVGPPTLTRPNGFFWSVTLNTSWLLYDGGARLAREDALSARTRELELDLALRTRQERAAITRAARAFGVAVDSAAVLDAREANAARALELARARFSAGLASSLEVRDATAELLDVRSARLANRLRVHLARNQHDLLVGPKAR